MKRANHKIAQTINASPESAWGIIGKVEGVDRWLAPITSCRVEGNKRYCGTEEGEFSEDILEVNNEEYVLKYAIPEQHLMPVSNILGQMKVTEDGGKANVEWSWEFDVEDKDEAQAKEMLSGVGSMGIGGIETLINQATAV